MSSEDVQKIVLGLGGILIGYFLKYYLDKKAQFSTRNAEVKREMYQDYVNLMIDFFDNTKSTKTTNQVLREIYAFYKQYVLYASPKVINAFSDLMQHFYKNPTDEDAQLSEEETRNLLKKMTNVFKQMRKDIGLSNRGLGRSGQRLLRAIINDYDEKIKPRRIKNTAEEISGTPTGIRPSEEQTSAFEEIKKVNIPNKKKKKRKKRK